MPSNCFQSFIHGGGYASNQLRNSNDYNDDSVPEAPKNRYGYTTNDSFQTDGTGRTDSTHGGNSATGRRNKNSGKGNRVTAMCRMKFTTNQKARDVIEPEPVDDVSFSQRSQVGLLHSDSVNFLSSSFEVDQGQGGDVDNWTHSRTTASSVSRSSTGTPSSRPIDANRSSANSSRTSDNYETSSETGLRSEKQSGFKGCMPKLRKTRELENKPDVRELQQREAQLQAQIQAQNYAHARARGAMPHIPEGAQLPKYDTSMVVGQQSNFPQIIFANREEKGYGPTRAETFVRNPRAHQMSLPLDEHQNYNQIYNKTHQRHDTMHQQGYEQHQYQHMHPNETSLDSYRSHSAPLESGREYKHEEFFLDNLANTLTTNYQDLQNNIHQLTGKSRAERLIEQAMLEERATVPNVVGFEELEEMDLVSEFGMGSTSGGRYSDNSSIFDHQQKIDEDYGPQRSSNIYSRGTDDRRWGGDESLGSRRVSRSEIDQRTLKWLQGGRQDPNHYNDGDVNYAQQYTAEFSNQYHEEPDTYEDLDLHRINTGIHSRQSTSYNIEEPLDVEEKFHSPAPASVRSLSSYYTSQSQSDHSSFDEDLSSPTKINHRTRHKNPITMAKRRDGRQLLMTSMDNDTSSTTSSSASPFSRSSKYREIHGTPYKITKDDRKNSVNSTQTQKWSNTSVTSQRRQDPRISMATHMEEEYESIYSEASSQSDEILDPKPTQRRSPRGVTDIYEL